ncbi:MAG: DUF4097 domain-containing protein [Acetatifactor sp.]|nr:DUF4097 domain-containing protein [Acetatifactor sp.]
MKDKIKSAIMDLFENVPESQEATELQEEMISNAEEKYEDLIQRGFTEEQSYTMVMGSIGDIEELLAELGAQTEEGKNKTKSEYWEKQCEYWKWQGEYFEKQARNLGQQAKNFGQQMEQQAGDFGQQAKEALNTFLTSGVIDNISSSIKQIISDVGINLQSDDGKYKDMEICNERKFATDGIASIVMEVESSPIDVDVQLTTDPEIFIQELYNKDPKEDQLLQYTVSKKQLKIHYGSNMIGFPRRGIVRVFIPESLAGSLDEIKILTASGDIKLEDIGAAKQVYKTMSGDVCGACSIGDVSIGTLSGDVAFESIEGEVQVKTVSGDVKVQKTVGKTNVSTASGDAKIKECQGDAFFRTASGDVECNLTQAGEKLEVSTASGDVELAIPEGIGVQMTLNTASGDIDTFCDCISTDENVKYVKTGKRAVGTIGEEPYLKIKVNTASGDIEINR